MLFTHFSKAAWKQILIVYLVAIWVRKIEQGLYSNGLPQNVIRVQKSQDKNLDGLVVLQLLRKKLSILWQEIEVMLIKLFTVMNKM